MFVYAFSQILSIFIYVASSSLRSRIINICNSLLKSTPGHSNCTCVPIFWIRRTYFLEVQQTLNHRRRVIRERGARAPSPSPQFLKAIVKSLFSPTRFLATYFECPSVCFISPDAYALNPYCHHSSLAFNLLNLHTNIYQSALLKSISSRC